MFTIFTTLMKTGPALGLNGREAGRIVAQTGAGAAESAAGE
jgi:hypothetical protein